MTTLLYFKFHFASFSYFLFSISLEILSTVLISLVILLFVQVTHIGTYLKHKKFTKIIILNRSATREEKFDIYTYFFIKTNIIILEFSIITIISTGSLQIPKRPFAEKIPNKNFFMDIQTTTPLRTY